MRKIIKTIKNVPKALRAAWLYDKAIEAAARSKFAEAERICEKVRNLVGESMVGPIILQAHCLYEIGNCERSRKLFFKAESVVKDENKISEDDKNYLLRYIYAHNYEWFCHVNQDQFNSTRNILIDNVSGQWRRNFPINTIEQ